MKFFCIYRRLTEIIDKNKLEGKFYLGGEEQLLPNWRWNEHMKLNGKSFIIVNILFYHLYISCISFLIKEVWKKFSTF